MCHCEHFNLKVHILHKLEHGAFVWVVPLTDVQHGKPKLNTHTEATIAIKLLNSIRKQPTAITHTHNRRIYFSIPLLIVA